MPRALRRGATWAALGLAMSLGVACGVVTAGTAPSRPRSEASRPVSQPPSPRAAGRESGASPGATRPAGPPGPPALVQPSPDHPLTILVIGDSLGMDLGFGLRDVVGKRPDVRLVLKAVGSSGLVNRSYYDWPAELRQELAAFRPQVVVAMFGGNDAVSFIQDGRYVKFGGDLWKEAYGARVAAVMEEATQAGAHVVWVGMPIMSPAAVLSNTAMQELNAVYEAEAAAHPGVLYVSSWELFQDASGRYTRYIRDASGVLQDVRAPDGVHIATPAGNALLASAVVAALDRSEGIRLCPAKSPYWNWAQFDCPAAKPASIAPS
ncbi:MAG: DUF459 domain-containing protein [Bacillota bacterium]|nr:DUF459 domain-containing protein [Bacillota bacterium]